MLIYESIICVVLLVRMVCLNYIVLKYVGILNVVPLVDYVHSVTSYKSCHRIYKPLYPINKHNLKHLSTITSHLRILKITEIYVLGRFSNQKTLRNYKYFSSNEIPHLRNGYNVIKIDIHMQMSDNMYH